MLYWNANFQIPNSGVQALDVYAVLSGDSEGKTIVDFYADQYGKNLLFTKEFYIPPNVSPYAYLLELEYFKNYSIKTQ
jgi:hypothetical protein